MTQYASFHNHTEYSILDGMSRVDGLARRAAELDIPCLGISDHGNVFAAMKHYRACNEYGVKPAIGMEAYLAPGDMTVAERVVWGEIEDSGRVRTMPTRGAYSHLSLIAENATGLRNLYELQGLAYRRGRYYEPRVDKSALEAHAEGLIVFSGCMGSEISMLLRLGKTDEAEQTTAFFAEHFPGRFFIEIMDHGIPAEGPLNKSLIDLAHRFNLPLVATSDSHYTLQADAETHERILCLQTYTTVSDPKRFVFSGSGYHLQSYEEMASKFSEIPEALTNTLVIAERIQDYSDAFRRRDLMPKVEGDLWGQANAGLYEIIKDRLDWEDTNIYGERLDYELQIIEDRGYAGYFLALADICDFARRSGIRMSPARGSAGGSLVAYCLGITGIDPVHYGLIFERFLNPERLSPPDIDTDFQASRRDEVIRYAMDKYGADHACQLITFGTMKTRAAIKDSARVLEVPIAQSNALVKLVPPDRRGRGTPLSDVPEIGRKNKPVYDLALALEGSVRQAGVHAGAVVISPRPLTEVMPIKTKDAKDPSIISGFDMDEVETLGLVKYDILGVKTLDIIETCLEYIRVGANA